MSESLLSKALQIVNQEETSPMLEDCFAPMDDILNAKFERTEATIDFTKEKEEEYEEYNSYREEEEEVDIPYPQPSFTEEDEEAYNDFIKAYWDGAKERIANPKYIKKCKDAFEETGMKVSGALLPEKEDNFINLPFNYFSNSKPTIPNLPSEHYNVDLSNVIQCDGEVYLKIMNLSSLIPAYMVFYLDNPDEPYLNNCPIVPMIFDNVDDILATLSQLYKKIVLLDTSYRTYDEE